MADGIWSMDHRPLAISHQPSAISHDMVRLSVNVNKVATLRNSRGGAVPSVLDAVRVCVEAGAPGITVHPRADQRHITPADVREIARLLRPERGSGSQRVEGP